MNKKTIILKIFIILIILLMQVNSVNAFGWLLAEESNMDIDIEIGKTSAIHASDTMIGKFVGVFQIVGSVLSVVALVIIGFRYLCSSVEERASTKGIIIYYVIGAVLVFVTSNVLSIAYNIINGISV